MWWSGRKRERIWLPDWENIRSLKFDKESRKNRNRTGETLRNDRKWYSVQLNKGRGKDKGRGRCSGWGSNLVHEHFNKIF